MGRKSVSALLIAAGAILLPIALFIIGVRGPCNGFWRPAGGSHRGRDRPAQTPRVFLPDRRAFPAAALGVSIAAAVLALGLEISPWSAVLNFGRPGEDGGVVFTQHLLQLQPHTHWVRQFCADDDRPSDVALLALAVAGIWGMGPEAKASSAVCWPPSAPDAPRFLRAGYFGAVPACIWLSAGLPGGAGPRQPLNRQSLCYLRSQTPRPP